MDFLIAESLKACILICREEVSFHDKSWVSGSKSWVWLGERVNRGDSAGSLQAEFGSGASVCSNDEVAGYSSLWRNELVVGVSGARFRKSASSFPPGFSRAMSSRSFNVSVTEAPHCENDDAASVVDEPLVNNYDWLVPEAMPELSPTMVLNPEFVHNINMQAKLRHQVCGDFQNFIAI